LVTYNARNEKYIKKCLNAGFPDFSRPSKSPLPLRFRFQNYVFLSCLHHFSKSLQQNPASYQTTPKSLTRPSSTNFHSFTSEFQNLLPPTPQYKHTQTHTHTHTHKINKICNLKFSAISFFSLQLCLLHNLNTSSERGWGGSRLLMT
jgi:hypothetical protein